MRILLAGASGYLGTTLRHRLEQDDHQVTGLTRHEPGPDEVRWDPARAPLGTEVVENADVVVNLCGSSLLGVPHVAGYRERLFESRVRTTRTLADAIAASDRKPAFLAGNGISWYGDHGDELLTEDSDSRGNALLTRVTRDWQAATGPATAAGARVCILRTSPVFGSGSMVATMLGRVFGLGVGGRIGNGHQWFPLISTHDWMEAVIRLVDDETLSGPVNLVAPELPTNAEFTRELGRVLHRPAVVPVPAVAVRLAAGPMAPELLNSVRARPQVLLDAGFDFRHRDVGDVLAFTYGPA